MDAVVYAHADQFDQAQERGSLDPIAEDGSVPVAGAPLAASEPRR